MRSLYVVDEWEALRSTQPLARQVGGGRLQNI